MAIAGQLLIELGANVARLTTDLQNAQRQITGFVGQTQKAFSVLGSALGIGSISAVFKSWVKEAAEAEQQEYKLANALRSRGVASKEVLEILTRQAKQLQDTTIFSDEEILRAYRFATAIGVSTAKLKETTEIAAEMAKQYDLDLNDAVEKVSLAIEGNVRAIKKLDPTLSEAMKTAKDAEERFNLLKERFEKDPNAIDIYTNAVKKYDNQWNEFKENAGKYYLPALKGLLWYFTELIKNYQKYVPGELQLGGGLGVETTINEKEAQKILKEKGFGGAPGAKAGNSAKDYTLKRIEFERKLIEETAKMEYDLYKDNITAKYTFTVINLDEEYKAALETAKKIGANKSKVEEEYGKRYKLANRQFLQDYAKQEIEWGSYILEQKKKGQEEYFDFLAEKAKEREEVELQYAHELASIMQSIYQGKISGIADIAPELAKFVDFQAQQSKGLESTDPYTQRYEAEKQHLENIENLYINHAATKQELIDAYNSYAKAEEDRKYNYMEKSGIGYLGAAKELMQNLYTATGSKNKALFNMMKAFAIAETIISTYSSAQKTFEIVQEQTENYYAAAAAAAVVTAAGLARVATIASTNPGSGSGGGGSTVGAIPSGDTQEAGTPYQHGGITNIYVYGSVVDHDAFVREIIPSLNKAQQKDNVH